MSQHIEFIQDCQPVYFGRFVGCHPLSVRMPIQHPVFIVSAGHEHKFRATVRFPFHTCWFKVFTHIFVQLFRRMPNPALETKPPSHAFCFSIGFIGGLSQLER